MESPEKTPIQKLETKMHELLNTGIGGILRVRGIMLIQGFGISK